MSLPLTPPLSDGQANQPSSGQAPATPQVSRRIEDLDPPYSAYPAVDLTAALYPEAGIWGMGIRHVDSHARWVFEKWFNWNLNDYYAIHVNDPNNPASADIIQDDRARYELFVPREHMPEGDVTVFGRVLRVASNQESTSPPQTILIKTTRPGGTDRDPGCEWHTGLVMSVEGFPEGAIVNPENTRDGVWCLIERYEHVRKNDVIELSWDGIFVQHIVSPAEAAEAGVIRVFVSKAVIDQGGQLGELTLRFRVRDVVGNFSGEKYQYSKAYTLNSELDPSLLSPPIFLVDGAESTQVDFDAQAESTFEVLALTPRQFPAPVPSYKIAVTLFATLADGTHQAFPLPEVIDENLGVTYVTIARETIGSLVGGSFRVSFQWLKPDSPALSGSTTVTVIGTLVLMPAVTVAPIEFGMIDPDHDVTVTLPHYQPHNKDWLETLVIEYRQPGGGGELYTQPQLAGVQGGNRTVTKETLQRFNGLGTVYFYYQVNDGAARNVGSGPLEIRKSQEFAAQVGERIAEMPVAILQGAQGNNINPADVAGPSVLLTLPYTGTLTGDLIHWNCIGSGIDGSLSNTIQINGGTAGQPLVFPVDRLILDNNLNGSLRISYSLQRTEPLLTLRSEVLNLTVGIGVQLERPVVEEAQPSSDLLDPLAALDGAHVRVQYQPMLVTDQIQVEWLAADGIGSITVPVQGEPATGVVSALIPARILAQGLRAGGNQVSVLYHFTRGTFRYESETVVLNVLPLTGLPAPFIEGIGDEQDLVLSNLLEGARTLTAPWNFIHPDSRVWMEYRGTFADDQPYSEMTYTSHRLGEDDAQYGLRPPAPIEALQRLKNASPLTIQVTVGFSESQDIAFAVPFPTRTYNIRVDYFSDLTDFFGYNWNGWANVVDGRGALVVDGAENVVWRASKSASENLEPGVQKSYTDLKANTQYEVSFYCKTTGDASQTTAKIEFAGVIIPKSVTPDRNWEKFSHTFTTPATPPIQNQTARISFSINRETTFFMDKIQVREIH